jgi:hypothetical protein
VQIGQERDLLKEESGRGLFFFMKRQQAAGDRRLATGNPDSLALFPMPEN